MIKPSIEFFTQPAEQLAPNLLGWQLIHESPDGTTAGTIVETEAYLGAGDPACHASRGQTARNQVMFGDGGRAYVYFTYGMHYCFNVVSGPEGRGEAVLIRALEPTEGKDLMARRRSAKVGNGLPNTEHHIPDTKLCSGPAKLVQAMGINMTLNGHYLTRKPLYLVPPSQPVTQSVTTTRIGISRAGGLPLRWYIKGNRFISKPK